MIFGGLVPPLGALEPMVRRMLAPSVAREPSETMDELIADIEAGRVICWLITEGDEVCGVVVTEIHGTVSRTCVIRHCAGAQIREWLHYLARIEWWAKNVELCDSIELIGREGWQRVLGWERTAVQLRKSL